MASIGKLSATLEVTEKKKHRLQNAILSVALEWKALEEHLESIQQSFEQCVCEMDSKEKHLDFVRKSVSESNDDLELLRIGVKERFEELEVRENELKLFHEKQIRDFELREAKLGSIRRSIMEEVELGEQKLGEQCKLVEGLFQKFEFEGKQFELIQKSMDQRWKEIDGKEKHFESRSKELHLVQDWIERRAKELDTKEEHLEERYKEFEVTEKQLDDAKKSNEEWSAELDSREKKFYSVKENVTQCYEDIQLSKMKMESEEKMIKERSKELELKEKQLGDRCKEHQLKEEKFATTLHSNVKIELPGNMPHDDQLCTTMEGKSLQIFVNESSSVRCDEICDALQWSSDPAKLVLDAMEGFYPPHLKNGDIEFEGNVVRRSCIFLLEKLVTISSRIQPRVKEEALKLAYEWKLKMGAVAKNSMEVLGFLQLLASYKLISEFDSDELWNLFEIVAEHKAAPKLCRVLGFVDGIPDLIKNLLKKKQHLVALRYIFAFELVNKFQPLPLLRGYLKYCRKMAYKSPHVQNRAIEERVAAVIRGIDDHKPEIKSSISHLEECIEQLITLKDGNICSVPANQKKLLSSITDHTPTNLFNNASILPKITASTIGPAPSMAFILATMDGKRLQTFLNEHLEEHELLRNEVSTALQLSVDSAELVLDAVQGFYPPHLKKGNLDFEACICRRSCMLLLEQLMRLSPQITPRVKEFAMELAIDWRKKMRSEIEILGFLQIVGAYRMAFAFDVNKLSTLFGTVVHLRHAPELCQVLGISEKFPVGDVLHPQEEVDQSSSKLPLLSNKVTSSYMGPQLDLKSLCTTMESKEVPNSIQFSLDPAKLVLDALKGCYYSNLKGNMNPRRDVLGNCVLFLEQLMRVSNEIKPDVQKEAQYFALDWRGEIVKSKKPLKVVIFLQLVAIYKLVSSFSADEILGFFGCVDWHCQVIDLFPIPELADKIPDFIGRLIERERPLAAVKFICAYGLVDKFPLVPLLKAHLTHSEEVADKICKKWNNSPRAQERVTKKELEALRTVVKCITDLGLESEFSPKNLKTRIKWLEKNVYRRFGVPHPASEAHAWQQAGKFFITSTLAPASSSEAQLQKETTSKCIGPPAPVSAPSSDAQVSKKSGKKRTAPIHAPAFMTQQHYQQARKRPRKTITRPTSSKVLVDTAHPIHSAEPPFQHPLCFLSEQIAPYITPPAEYCGARRSSPVTSDMSYLNWEWEMDAPANRSAMPFDSSGYQFG